jgi:Protein of unknown function (DUF1279)
LATIIKNSNTATQQHQHITMVQRSAFAIAVASFLFSCEAWSPALNGVISRTPTRTIGRGHQTGFLKLSALTEPKEAEAATKPEEPTPEETTKKFGLEAGIFQSLKQKNDGGESAKSLLKRYGIAYLATSIPLAIVSFVICYLLVDNGVDVAGLLGKVGIEASGGSETAGTVAIAYAAHKAASPIRFPPTVILTPIVAKLIGKEPNEEVAE